MSFFSQCGGPRGHVTARYLEVGVGARLGRVREPPALRAQRLRPHLRVWGQNGAAGGGREDAQRQGALSPGFNAAESYDHAKRLNKRFKGPVCKMWPHLLFFYFAKSLIDYTYITIQ